MRNTLPDRVRLGAFEVDLRVGELRGGERSIILPEQALRVLRMLVERDGELVEREDIRKTLWPNDTVVEFDHSINTAIRNLHRALGDSPDEPRYIQTIPRRGYRLLMPVERVDDSSSAEPSVEPKEILGAPSTGNLIGKKVSHYRVLEVLGGGGMGMLYKAEDLKLGRRVALKFLPDELANDPVALQRFEREARTSSSLDHPNICTIYEVEEHEEQPFIVMQLLQGETLRDRLATLAAEQKKLGLQELLEIAVQICDGLQAAHAKGVIHRDIKPANIFLTTSGQVKILDFGLAKLVGTTHETENDALRIDPESAAAVPQHARSTTPDVTLTRLGVAVGTAGYMSPEQVRGDKLDARTDIFSFGLVLYGMAAGQRAFSGETAAIVHDAIVNKVPVPLHQLNSKVPPQLEGIVNRALEKDKKRRYQSASKFGRDLAQLKDDTDSGLAKATGPSKRRWILRFAVLAFAVAVSLALGWLGWRRLGPRPKFVKRQPTFNSPGNRVNAGAISPDGKYVAYHDQTGLYLRNLNSGETHRVGLPAGLPRGIPVDLRWFPGGEKLLLTVFGKAVTFG